jgi:hypothetical protein
MSNEGNGARPLDSGCSRQRRGYWSLSVDRDPEQNQKSKTGISGGRGKRGGQTVKGSRTQDISP